MILRAAILTFLVLAVPPSGFAEPRHGASVDNYARASWTEQDGLPSTLIWSIAQDLAGYIWLGTDAGLVRFDGVRFARWEEINDSPLPGNAVRALLVGHDGSLWIGFNDGGVSRYGDGGLTHYTTQDGVPDRVVGLLEDRDGLIWASGFGGLARFRDGRWERLGKSSGLPERGTSVIYEDSRSDLWLVVGAELFRKAHDRDVFEPFPLRFPVRGMAEDARGRVWATGPERVLSGIGFDAPDSFRLMADLQSLNGWRMIRARDNNLWIATLGDGLLRVSPPEEGDRPVIDRFSGRRFLTNDVVRSVFEDREGNIWAGTQSGLNRLSASPFFSLQTESGLSDSIRALTATAEGSIWVGTDDGLYRFFPDGTRRRYDERDGLATSAIGALHVDRRGTLLVSSDRGGVSRFAAGRFSKLAQPAGASSPFTWAMTSDSREDLWLCNLDGVQIVSSRRVVASPDDMEAIAHKACTSALTDSRDAVWLGFADGTIARTAGSRLQVFSRSDLPLGGSVNTIFEDSAGAVWVATERGLLGFTGDAFVSVGGAVLQGARSMLDDNQGYLWFGTRSGFIRVNGHQLRHARSNASLSFDYRIYDSFDGLRGLPVSVRGNPNATRGADGRLWMVTAQGVTGVDPRKLGITRVPPPVRVERILADDQVASVGTEVRLSSEVSRVQIDYTALSYAVPTKIRFRYKLEGFDRDWIDAGTRRQAQYMNLPPRDYTFRVMANNDGVWSSSAGTFSFSIAPALYETRVFQLASIIAFSLIIVAAWQLKLRTVQNRLLAVVQERSRMAREVHDTLLQGLVSVALQLQALAMKVQSAPEAARLTCEELRDQVEANIRDVRLSIWDLRSPIEVRDLPMALRDAGKSIADTKAVAFALGVTGVPRDLPPKTKEAIFRIGKEAILNAIRHAQPSRVEVHINFSEGLTRLTVSDDGQGFNPDLTLDQHQICDHWGLASMKERAKQIGARFEIFSSATGGTRIEVEVGRQGMAAR